MLGFITSIIGLQVLLLVKLLSIIGAFVLVIYLGWFVDKY